MSLNPFLTQNFYKREKTCVGKATNGLIIGGVTGFLIGSMQSLWSGMPFQRLHVDGSFKQSLKTIIKPTVLFGCAGLAFNATDCILREGRKVDDWKNQFASGALAGFIMSLVKINIKSSILLTVSTGAFAVLLKESGENILAPVDERSYKKRHYKPSQILEDKAEETAASSSH